MSCEAKEASFKATAEALALIETQAIGDRFKAGLDILKLISAVDLSEMMALISAVRDLGAQADVAGKVRAAINVAKILAKLTPTDADDKLVIALDSMLTPDMLAVVTRIVQGLLGTVTAQDATASAADQQYATAAGIPWALLTKIALALVDIISTLQKPAAT